MSNEPSDKDPWMDDAWEADEEPVLVRIVRKALEPYIGRVPPERLAEYRKALVLFITTHPAMAARYERVRQRPVVVASSGDVLKDDAPVLDDVLKAAIGSKSGA
jgi:hypothetical protein